MLGLLICSLFHLDPLERLKKHAPWAGQLCHEQALTSKEHSAHSAHALDAVIDLFREAGQVAGADENRLIRFKLMFDKIAGSVDKGGSLSGYGLKKKAGTSKERCSGTLSNTDVNGDLWAKSRHKRSLGRNDRPILQIPGYDPSRLIGCQSHLTVISSGLYQGKRETFTRDNDYRAKEITRLPVESVPS